MDAKEAEVECPCCGSRILFDVRTSNVVRWNRGRELDESGRPKVSEEDWASANARVKGRLDSAADKLDAGSRSAIESAIKRVNDAMTGEDVTAIESATSDLEQAAHALSKHMYESAGAGGAGAGAAGAPPSGDGHGGGAKPGEEDVIDAEFEKT